MFYLVLAATMTICMFFMPESPYALLQKGKEEQGAKSLQWLRGKKYDITDDLAEMKQTVQVCILLEYFRMLVISFNISDPKRNEECFFRGTVHNRNVP